jgi:hypothetical protein
MRKELLRELLGFWRLPIPDEHHCARIEGVTPVGAGLDPFAAIAALILHCAHRPVT